MPQVMFTVPRDKLLVVNPEIEREEEEAEIVNPEPQQDEEMSVGEGSAHHHHYHHAMMTLEERERLIGDRERDYRKPTYTDDDVFAEPTAPSSRKGKETMRG